MSDLAPPTLSAEGSATQRAYVTLRHMIVTGQLQPGEKLKIDTLRQRLDTGASPIREALSLLTSDNLVERIDQRGFRAAEVSAANFNEILTLRCTLEDLALRQSLARADDAWEERLVLAHHRMSRAASEDITRFEEVHKAFHMTLLDRAEAPILLKFCSQLYDLNIRYRYLAGRASNYGRRDIGDEHARILDAAVSRDADEASARLLSHYRKTGAYLTGLFDTGALG
ncbi:GntR family transcriptional regulator [Pseudaestuariivita atlantica]|uniref:GntR family transcriptional regulator n=1 Tax=Pseudaestuariivita atlantica TaxID=1317121 RepID=A0A0L1JT54_9RHOB|nr:GntR family transcriptional regulator [Pseudaestuariivita atlantica]KNG94939.1 GntR family transcriptional regulator [Pseudaestuariivita atlantica]